jgi:adenosylcobyric acid synthase
VDGLGLLPVDTVFAPEKLLRHVRGTLGRDTPATGYEIPHGRPRRRGAAALFDDGTPDGEGCVDGAVFGTSWHGVLEGDAVRRALLGRIARLAGRDWLPGDEPFAAVRERHLDRLGDLIEEHADTAALLELVERGAPTDLPVLAPGAALCSSS